MKRYLFALFSLFVFACGAPSPEFLPKTDTGQDQQGLVAKIGYGFSQLGNFPRACLWTNPSEFCLVPQRQAGAAPAYDRYFHIAGPLPWPTTTGGWLQDPGGAGNAEEYYQANATDAAHPWRFFSATQDPFGGDVDLLISDNEGISALNTGFDIGLDHFFRVVCNHFGSEPVSIPSGSATVDICSQIGVQVDIGSFTGWVNSIPGVNNSVRTAWSRAFWGHVMGFALGIGEDITTENSFMSAAWNQSLIPTTATAKQLCLAKSFSFESPTAIGEIGTCP